MSENKNPPPVQHVRAGDRVLVREFPGYPAQAGTIAAVEYKIALDNGDGEEVHPMDADMLTCSREDFELLAAPVSNGDVVAIPRKVIADLYRFFHQAWEGNGRVTSEGSHGKDLLDWREVVSSYHRQPSAPVSREEGD